MKVDGFLKAISLTLRIILLIAAAGAIINAEWMVLFVISIAVGLTFLPKLIESRYRIDIPEEFEILITVFVYASLFLGEVHSYYTVFWWWDIVLHGASGLALALTGFLILFMLYETKKIKASPRGIAFFSFCFALAVGALWEIAEFTVDATIGTSLKGYPMQPSLLDTMRDLIVDAVGALIVSVFGYFYLRGKKYLFNGMVKRFAKKNPRLFK
ncbi:MAG: hypothetical protein Q7S65_00260 [Nanoarchaeota archaeon]|nr:hypothetical protein [Nanoarchaeota archaeon]